MFYSKSKSFYKLFTFTIKLLFVSRGMGTPTESLSSKQRLFKFVHLSPTSPLIDMSAAACSRAKWKPKIQIKFLD